MRKRVLEQAAQRRRRSRTACASRPSTRSACRSRASCRCPRSSASPPGIVEDRARALPRGGGARARAARATNPRKVATAARPPRQQRRHRRRAASPACSRGATSGCARPAARRRAPNWKWRLLPNEKGLLEQARALDARASVEFARERPDLKDRRLAKEAQARAAARGQRAAAAGARPAAGASAREVFRRRSGRRSRRCSRCCRVAAAQLKLVFAARGEADFTEIAQGAVRALGSVEDPTDLLL